MNFLRAFALLAALIVPLSVGNAQQIPAKSPVVGASLTLSASSSSSTVSLTADITLFPVIQLINNGTTDAFCNYGSSSVVATVNSIAVPAGSSQAFNAQTGNTKVACITASSTTTIRVNQLSAPPQFARGSVGNSGGGSVNNTVTNTYTSGPVTIATSDTFSLINSASAVAAALANGTVDGHPIVVKNYGAGTVTLTATIDGTPSTAVTMVKGAVIDLAWNVALSTYLITH